MSTPEIIRKLTEQIGAGINTEVQVVYVLAGIRKIIERDGLRARFRSLNFHCDWVLHALLDRADARRVLALFDAAHPLLKGDVKLSDLPANLRTAITELSHMQSFEAEIEQFCADYGLPSLQQPPNTWSRFLYLYGEVIEDIPLTFPSGGGSHITHVVVDCATARDALFHPDGSEEILFKISWNIYNGTAKYGEIFVVHSFTLKAP